MGKTWAETMENLSYCNHYKVKGSKACFDCKNTDCRHNMHAEKPEGGRMMDRLLDEQIDEIRKADAFPTLIATIERLVSERDALARYIYSLDIDEDVCKKNPDCDEFNHTETDCITCITKALAYQKEAV